MSAGLPVLRHAQIDHILRALAAGQCCAVYGLSNTGKSPLLRSLAEPEFTQRFSELAGGPGVLFYVDCNRLVELSATGFYEVVVRTLLEFIEDPATAPAPTPELLQQLRDYHNRITAGPTFQASLAFNTALSESCEKLGLGLVMLLDEFDEVYAALEERTLLNLRALKDHSRGRLTYVTATERPLAEIGGRGDNEFVELFAAHTLPLGLLDRDDARRVITGLGAGALPEATLEHIVRLAGGHLGLLTALSQSALRGPDGARLASDVTARAECLKLWNQLRPDEQAALAALVTAPEDGIGGAVADRLRALGLVTDGPERPQVFSELFSSFASRHAARPLTTAPGVVVDEDAGEVWVDGAKVTVLTDLEYRLMRLLSERRDRLTTKDMIVEAVWGGEYLDRVDDARIEKLVSRLRSKVEPDPARPRYLLTQRGRGYKLSSTAVTRGENDES